MGVEFISRRSDPVAVKLGSLEDLAGDAAAPADGPWAPALDLINEASGKITRYEQNLARFQAAVDRNARKAEADRLSLMERIDHLTGLLQASCANYEKTLALLDSSTRLCALQRLQLRQMAEALEEANSNAAEMTGLIKQMHGIMAHNLQADSEA
jgi:hypothetical protein